MRNHPLLTGLLAVWIGSSAVIAQAESSPRKPNVIFIYADDLGYAELGSYGQTKIKTPNLDQLADQGMRWTQFYTSSPVCASARCSLLTGKHGGHAYARDNSEIGSWESYRGQGPIPAQEFTIAEMFKSQDYATGAFGKWGLGEVGSSGDPLKQGFDRFFGYNCQRHAHNYYPRYLIDNDQQRPLPGNDRGLTGEQYAPKLIADEMLTFIRDHKDQPFFAYYATVIPHLALQVPDQELKQYEGLWDETPYAGNSYLPHPKPRAAYAAMISYMDKQVGRIMQLLDELGLADDTIIFFTSDNGATYLKGQVDYEFFNSVGPLRGLKGSVYEGGIREPLLVRWPNRIPAGSVSHLPAAQYDMLATLADMINAPAPTDSDGVSLLPTLLGQTDQQPARDYLFWEFGGYGGQQAVRLGDWKAVRPKMHKGNMRIELYNLASDESEKHDVADQHPDLVARFERVMRDEHTPSKLFPLKVLDEQ